MEGCYYGEMKWDFAIGVVLGLAGIGVTLAGGPPLHWLARFTFAGAAIVLVWKVAHEWGRTMSAPLAVTLLAVTLAGLCGSQLWISMNEERLTAAVGSEAAKPTSSATTTVGASSPRLQTVVTTLRGTRPPRRHRRIASVSAAAAPRIVTLNCGLSGGVNNGVYEANCEGK